MGDLTKNFSRAEFACKCCGKIVVEPRLVEALQRLRDLANMPIRVISGYRCKEHNTKVGGAKNSYHTKGVAADIVIDDLSVAQMYRLAEEIEEFHNGGIGAYPDDGFIHVDVRDGRARWAKVGGRYVSIEEALKAAEASSATVAQ